MTPARIRDALAEARSDIERNIELVTLLDDVECPVTWDELQLGPESTDVLQFLNRLELRTLARELEEPELL